MKLQLVAKYEKKIEGGALWGLEKISQKKFQKFLSVTVPKNVKGGALWNFLTSIVLQNVETNEGDHLLQSKKFQKKSHSAKKKWAMGDP